MKILILQDIEFWNKNPLLDDIKETDDEDRHSNYASYAIKQLNNYIISLDQMIAYLFLNSTCRSHKIWFPVQQYHNNQAQVNFQNICPSQQK